MGTVFTSEGRLNIKNARFADDQGPLDPNCACTHVRRTVGPTSGIFLSQRVVRIVSTDGAQHVFLFGPDAPDTSFDQRESVSCPSRVRSISLAIEGVTGRGNAGHGTSSILTLI